MFLLHASNRLLLLEVELCSSGFCRLQYSNTWGFVGICWPRTLGIGVSSSTKFGFKIPWNDFDYFTSLLCTTRFEGLLSLSLLALSDERVFWVVKPENYGVKFRSSSSSSIIGHYNSCSPRAKSLHLSCTSTFFKFLQSENALTFFELESSLLRGDSVAGFGEWYSWHVW